MIQWWVREKLEANGLFLEVVVHGWIVADDLRICFDYVELHNKLKQVSVVVRYL
jgi:hypothetical protein